MRAYLDEIASTPLLTAAQEVALAKRIEAGVYAGELLSQADAGQRRLTVDREDLAAVARDGERAKDHMIRAILRLVVAAGRRYGRRDEAAAARPRAGAAAAARAHHVRIG